MIVIVRIHEKQFNQHRAMRISWHPDAVDTGLCCWLEHLNELSYCELTTNLHSLLLSQTNHDRE
jgi:hypothetical protein